MFLQDRQAPLPYAFKYTGFEAGKWVVNVGALFGLATRLALFYKSESHFTETEKKQMFLAVFWVQCSPCLALYIRWREMDCSLNFLRMFTHISKLQCGPH